MNQRATLAQVAAEDPALRVRDGQLEIELRFRVLDSQTVAAISALGARIEHVSYRFARVLALADPDLLPDLASLPGVASIHPQYGAQRSAGSVAGQGDAAVRADTARARFGLDGSGVRVGILSDSFHLRLRGSITGSGCERRLTGAKDQVSGDLPAEVVVLDEGPARSPDEGAAMGEIIHDLAPGAALLFATAFSDEATFAENIGALVACGLDILVDDVIYFAEPMFQDGIIAQAAQAAVDAGVAFFSAAGNSGPAGVEAVYHDGVPEQDDEMTPPTGNDFHDFGGGNRFAAITVPANCGIRLVLQWDESFSGTLGAGASTDLDLYLFNAARPDATVVGSGTDPQGCSTTTDGQSGDPLEIADYFNTSGMPLTIYAAVDHFCGRPEVRFRIATYQSNCVLSQKYAFAPEVFSSAQIYGHGAAAGVATVAAVFYAEIDRGGAVTGAPDTINVEPFSARGGDLPIAIDALGARLPDGPVRRFKPDLAAPDGVNTSFFGADVADDDDTLPNFLGTSAAAPHVAAVAALLRQAHPSLSPAALVEILRSSAVDIEAPGRDALAGDGLIDALTALALPPPPTQSPTPSPLPTATPTPAPGPGDCDGNRRVTVDELILAVRIALREAAATACLAADTNGDGQVAITELIRAVAIALA
jgi:subtilisin family serine protease